MYRRLMEILEDESLIRDEVRVLAIVVAYHPEPGTLLTLVEKLTAEVDEVLVVDNTPSNDDIVWVALSSMANKTTDLSVVRIGENLGIAVALNIGIDVARKERFTHVLLSDQDSQPEAGMVAGLLEAERCARNCRINVGAVGPVFVDKLTGIEFPFQVQESGRLFYSSACPTAERPDIETLCLITSGCLIRLDVLNQVGGMMDQLFIDNVDVEWCHRAISKGYALIGSRRGLMVHNMGDMCVRVWVFGWRPMNGYSPTRLYYRFRNFIHLSRLSYIQLRWKIRVCWYFLGTFYGHAFFAENKRENIAAMVAGVLDGIKGKWGQRDSTSL